MRPYKGHHQEKRLAGVPASQEVNGLIHDPVGGVRMLRVDPGPCHPGIAVQAGVNDVTVKAKLFPQPGEIVICIEPVFIRRSILVPGGMQVSVMKDYIVESAQGAGRMHMHLPDALGMVAGLGQLSGQEMLIVPLHSVLIAYPAMGSLGQPGHNGCSGSDAGWNSGIGIGECHTLMRHCVQVRGFHNWMP
jgi:hypothetical protein